MPPLRRALIVDDEDDARASLRQLLASHPEVEIVGEAGDVPEALRLFRSLNPNLIFLDVQMPKRDGFALLPELQPLPDIIFVTAYDCFAVKAFEVNAVDFLVKPIHPERLEVSLARLARPVRRNAKPFTRDDSVFLYSDRELRVVAVTDILHVRADQNYGRVQTAHGKPLLVRRKMREWRRLLPVRLFLRVDRSTILNLSAIREFRPLEHRHAAVYFHGFDEPLELRRMAARRLRKAIRGISMS